jgi:flavin prenyltransferase
LGKKLNNPSQLPIIIAMTGASGAIYGIRVLELLRKEEISSHLIISPAGEQTILHETTYTIDQVHALATIWYGHDDIGAAISSGSFQTRGMIIAPCSIKTLSAVANSYSDNLIARAADVCLKEGRPLLLAVRETPLHLGHINLMQQAAHAGAVIFPPVPSFYNHPTSIDDLVTETAGRILARAGIPTDAYTQWSGSKTQA